MQVTELIKRLQKRLDCYGDLEVVFRDSEGEYVDPGMDVGSVYFDEDDERIVISDTYDFIDGDKEE